MIIRDFFDNSAIKIYVVPSSEPSRQDSSNEG